MNYLLRETANDCGTRIMTPKARMSKECDRNRSDNKRHAKRKMPFCFVLLAAITPMKHKSRQNIAVLGMMNEKEFHAVTASNRQHPQNHATHERFLGTNCPWIAELWEAHRKAQNTDALSSMGP